MMLTTTWLTVLLPVLATGAGTGEGRSSSSNNGGGGGGAHHYYSHLQGSSSSVQVVRPQQRQQQQEGRRHGTSSFTTLQPHPPIVAAAASSSAGGLGSEEDDTTDDLVTLEDPGYDLDQPYFDLEESGNVTALLGKTALLNCRVKNIGNKTVSWVRHRDIHLLTVGRFTYTSDERFSARHTAGSEDWLLLVHYVQRRDQGMYECQISTTPPLSHFIHLSVVVAETVIVGGPDVYINTGSRLSLTCSVKYSPEPPAFIFWYHDDKLVSYDRTRVGVVLSGEKGLVTTSRLLVQTADTRHSGNYTCSPANSHPKSVIVHVIAGDQPQPIVHENSCSVLNPLPILSLSSILFLFLLHHLSSLATSTAL